MKYFATIGALACIVVGALVYSLAPKEALGLSCIHETPAQNFARADAVFAGVVTGIVEMNEGDGQMGGDQNGTITFRTTKKWKGDISSSLTLTLGSYTSWYTTPKVGEEWVIFSQKEDGKLAMPLCGTAVKMSEAREVLSFLSTQGSGEPIVGGPSTPTPTPGGKACHQYTGGGVPNTFGKPYNVYSNALMMKANCSNDAAVLSLGTGSPQEFIYKQGFYFDGSDWKTLRFESTSNLTGNAWFTGSAQVSIPTTSFDAGEVVYMVGYVCVWRGAAGWKCGCADQACTQGKWQLQAIRIPERTLPSTPGDKDGEQWVCSMEAKLCPDGSAVGRSGPNCEFAACPTASGFQYTKPGFAAAAKELQENGSVSVIASFSAASGVSTSANGSIVATTDSIIASLKDGYLILARYSTVPYVALDITSEATLQRLHKHEKVTKVQLNTVSSTNTSGNDGYCSVLATGVRPSDSVVTACRNIYSEQACKNYASNAFPYKCSWVKTEGSPPPSGSN